MLTEWRRDPETAWLAEAPVHTTQQALRNLESAWSRHFDSLKKLKQRKIKPEEVVEPPRFKKKHRARQSFRYPDPKQSRVEPHNSRLFLPKLGLASVSQQPRPGGPAIERHPLLRRS